MFASPLPFGLGIDKPNVLSMSGTKPGTKPGTMEHGARRFPWRAACVEFTVIADPEQTADIIQEGGALVLVIEDNGRFRQETTFPGDIEPEIDVGTLRLTADSLVFNPDGETVSFAHTQFTSHLTYWDCEKRWPQCVPTSNRPRRIGHDRSPERQVKA